MSEADLPRKMRAIIPVPAPNHPNDTLANKFSIIMLPLELRKSRSFERCKEIEKESRAMAKTPYMYVNLFLMDLLAVYPVSFTRAMMVNSRCTAVISNLPGPRKEISIWGYKMEETMFWLPNVGTSGTRFQQGFFPEFSKSLTFPFQEFPFPTCLTGRKSGSPWPWTPE